MPKAPEARASAVQYDGAMLFVANSPIMSLSSAATVQGAFVAPCACEIEEIIYNVIAAPDGAPATFNIGTQANNDALVDAFSIATSVALGAKTLPLSDAAVVGTKLNKGDIITFDTGGEASTAGSVAISVVFKPQAAA